MLWFYLRHRGQPPRFFLRDDYSGLSPEQVEILNKAYQDVIIDLLGVLRPGERVKKEPEGVESVYTVSPQWKGFVFPKELKQKIADGLTVILHPTEGIPSGLNIPGYSNLP